VEKVRVFFSAVLLIHCFEAFFYNSLLFGKRALAESGEGYSNGADCVVMVNGTKAHAMDASVDYMVKIG
jgi:hypothetical protein